MNNLTWQEKIRIKLAIRTKCRKFHRNGYPEIRSADIEIYLFQYRWKKKPLKKLKHKIADIHHFSSNDFFDYQQIKIQTSQKKLSELDDFSDLF